MIALYWRAIFQVPEPPPEQTNVPLPMTDVPFIVSWPLKLQDFAPATTTPNAI